MLHSIYIFSFILDQCLEKMESSMKQKVHPEKNNDTKTNDSNDTISEKVGRVKTILQEISSNYSIRDNIVLPPIEVNTSNMESYVGKPKYLKDRQVLISDVQTCLREMHLMPQIIFVLFKIGRISRIPASLMVVMKMQQQVMVQ